MSTTKVFILSREYDDGVPRWEIEKVSFDGESLRQLVERLNRDPNNLRRKVQAYEVEGMTEMSANAVMSLESNEYTKQELLMNAIKDAETRLGSYIAVDDCEKADPYAKAQIALIKSWKQELSVLYGIVREN